MVPFVRGHDERSLFTLLWQPLLAPNCYQFNGSTITTICRRAWWFFSLIHHVISALTSILVCRRTCYQCFNSFLFSILLHMNRQLQLTVHNENYSSHMTICTLTIWIFSHPKDQNCLRRRGKINRREKSYIVAHILFHIQNYIVSHAYVFLNFSMIFNQTNRTLFS